MGHARVEVLPLSWTRATVPEPLLGGGSGATLTQWDATRSPTTRDVMLVGCVATPIPGWVDDMRIAVDSRTVALMHGSAERAVGGSLEVRSEGDVFRLRRAGAEGSVGIGRTFVGFEADAVV